MLSAVQQRIDELYPGASPLLTGVTHVFSAVRLPLIKSPLHVIKIGERAPRSERDFFVLNFARAQCDAILTTAQVVRAEPKLSHTVQGPLAAELVQYRRRVLGKAREPLCAILTRSGRLPVDHPVFRDPLEVVVLTLPQSVAKLKAELGSRARVVGLDALDAKLAVHWLRTQGTPGILVEAGPSTASVLYEAPSCVEQLRVSVCEAAIEPAAVGGELPPDAKLFAGLSRCSSAEFHEVSGPWRFECWARRV
jgi:riboflavin biosynthesis pyrimidine reductase